MNSRIALGCVQPSTHLQEHAELDRGVVAHRRVLAQIGRERRVRLAYVAASAYAIARLLANARCSARARAAAARSGASTSATTSSM
jgi:hypothetical protein